MPVKGNKVLQFANRQRAASWMNFQLKNLRPSVDPNNPPMYLMDVQGHRGDGVVFTVAVAFDKVRYDLLPAVKALEVAQGLLNGGIQQLMTFTGCDCTIDSECEKHNAGPVN